MIYNVSSLLTAREGAVRQETIEDGAVFTDRHRFYRISGPVQMLRTDRTILVSASVSATVKESCSRCLSPATIDIKTEFEEEFEPANRDLMSDRPSPVESDFDPALQIDARNMLDISDALAQALSLSVPLAPLCRSKCVGLCPVCFSDRNRSACSCDENPIDPRWNVLAGLQSVASNSEARR